MYLNILYFRIKKNIVWAYGFKAMTSLVVLYDIIIVSSIYGVTLNTQSVNITVVGTITVNIIFSKYM
jgi:hypothetical protein